MANLPDANDVTKSKVIQFRAPAKLLNAMHRAADRNFTSVSDIARLYISEHLRARGFLDESV